MVLYCNHNNLCIILCIERERGFSLSEWLTSVRPQVTSESLLTSQLVFYFLPNQINITYIHMFSIIPCLSSVIEEENFETIFFI